MTGNTVSNIVITYDDWHPCPSYEGGGFWTTRLFWDCECKENYIRPKKLNGCSICGAFEEDGQPDSRVTEVLEARLAVDTFISLGDALELVYELAEQNVLDPERVSFEGILLQHSRKQQQAIDVVGDFIANNFGEGDAIVPHFNLEQEAYRIDGVATFNEFFDYKRVEWLITDGLGNLARVQIMLGCNGNVLLHGDTIVLDEQGEEVSRSGVGKQLFEAERL